MRKQPFIPAIILLILEICTSCHRNSLKVPGSRIVHVVDTVFNLHGSAPHSRTEYLLSYYDDGRLREIVTLTSGSAFLDSTIFRYYDGFVTKTINNYLVDTMRLNSSGDIYKINNSVVFHYGGNKIIESWYGPDVYFNYWINGNDSMMIDTAKHDTIFNGFYPGMPALPGNFIYMQEFLVYGRPLTHNSNLILSTQLSKNSIYYYSYTFDNKGRITSCSLLESYGINHERLEITYSD